MPTITRIDLAPDGVVLHGPASAVFPAAVPKALDRGQAGLGMAELVPYSVVLENRTAEPLRVAMLCWSVETDHDLSRGPVAVSLSEGLLDV